MATRGGRADEKGNEWRPLEEWQAGRQMETRVAVSLAQCTGVCLDRH